ncbi:hypothetical protein SNA_18215 [Streptomyces natalensis ATCC 27448]|uniref:Uncharacterized protein n=1 Tax=Streptomyces natalensis ATCC 27448 TaxID=1240678 RepID=A0A0D7CLE7_9ACTN|nr:hypothetical protein SNA_18215 [Streptomyces natalensis ATCC 27448]
MPDSLAEQLDRDELSRLVREANDAGASYQQLADRAVDPETGEQLSKPYMQKLATNAVTTAPNAARLRAIAAALRQPLTVVQRAAARQFLDYKATELSGYDDDVRVIVAHLAGMTPTAKRRWRAMIEAVENVDEE